MLYACSFSRVTFIYERKGGRKEREERIVVSSTLFTAAIKNSCHVTCSKKHMLWLMVIGLCNISNLKHGLVQYEQSISNSESIFSQFYVWIYE